MFVWGGFNGAYLASGGRYNPTSCSCTANAGAPQTILVGHIATLDGSASSCATGLPTAYLWTPRLQALGLHGDDHQRHLGEPSITPDLAGVYSISLVVSTPTGRAPRHDLRHDHLLWAGPLSLSRSSRPRTPRSGHLHRPRWVRELCVDTYPEQHRRLPYPQRFHLRVHRRHRPSTDILRVTDTTCGVPVSVTVNVQGLAPQVTEAYFTPPTTNGATATTFYAKFNANVNSAEYRKLPAGLWTPMGGSGKNWQATVTVPSPASERNESYSVRGNITGGSGKTAEVQEALYVTSGPPPILLVHGWTFPSPCTDTGNCSSILNCSIQS